MQKFKDRPKIPEVSEALKIHNFLQDVSRLATANRHVLHDTSSNLHTCPTQKDF